MRSTLKLFVMLLSVAASPAFASQSTSRDGAAVASLATGATALDPVRARSGRLAERIPEVESSLDYQTARIAAGVERARPDFDRHESVKWMDPTYMAVP